MAKTKKKVEKIVGDIFDMSQTELVKGQITGNDYYDTFIRHRSSLASKVVQMAPDKCIVLCYSKRVLSREGVNEKLDLSECEPPIIDIVRKKSKGHEQAVVAMLRGIAKIPVVIVADKLGQIVNEGGYLDRKGLK